MSKTRSYLTALLIVSCVGGPVGAVTSPSVVKETVDHIWHDQRRMLTSPLRVNSTDLVVWGTAAGSLLYLAPEWGGGHSADERFEQGIDRTKRTGNFLRGFTHTGDAPVLISLSLAGYGLGRFQDNPGLQRGSLHLFEGLIDTGIVIEVVKVLAGRVRPINRPVHSKFKGPLGYFQHPSINSSFASGHSAMSFAAATIISHECKSYWVGVPVYMIAGGVAYSRIYVEKHWLSDVIAGSALGYSIGVLVEKNRHALPEKHAGRFYPIVNEDSIGIAWTRTW